MSHLGLEISDAGFLAAFADGSQLRHGNHGPTTSVLDWPGLAYHDSQKYSFGRDAEDKWFVHPRQINHHFWSRLSRESSALAVGGKSPAFSQLAFFFLRDYLPRLGGTAPDRVVLALPGGYLKDSATEDEKVGLLLGMAGELKLPLVALFDLACASLCAPDIGYLDPSLPVVVVDMHLHGADCTLLRSGQRLQRADWLAIPQSGHAELLRHLTTSMGNRFLRHTTFDILEDGRLEQLFYRQTKDFLLARTAEHHFQINTATRGYEMTATRDQLIADSAAHAQTLVQGAQTILQNNSLITEPCTVALTARAGLVPGIRTRLRSAGFNRLLLLPAGAAAAGAARLAADYPNLSDLADVPVVNQVPLDLARTMQREPWEVRMLKGRVSAGRAPTHVITDGIGRPLDGRPVFVIGSSAARPDLALPEEFSIAGDQCQVRLTRENGQVWWHENAGGDSVGRTAVQAGDRLVLRCGDKEIEVLFAACQH
jgi:hypothetical protein